MLHDWQTKQAVNNESKGKYATDSNKPGVELAA